MRLAWKLERLPKRSCIVKTLRLKKWIFGEHTSTSVRVSTSEPTIPEDFDPIFSQGVVIVGGHAVNLWASYYAARGDPILAQFSPFTSKDADIFLRDPALAAAVAAAAGWNFRSNPEPRQDDRQDERHVRIGYRRGTSITLSSQKISQTLTTRASPLGCPGMTAIAILNLKQRLSKLSEADRRMVAGYLLRLKHESPTGRREASRTMREMDEGKKIRLKDLAKQLGHA